MSPQIIQLGKCSWACWTIVDVTAHRRLRMGCTSIPWHRDVSVVHLYIVSGDCYHEEGFRLRRHWCYIDIWLDAFSVTHLHVVNCDGVARYVRKLLSRGGLTITSANVLYCHIIDVYSHSVISSCCISVHVCVYMCVCVCVCVCVSYTRHATI